MELKFNVEIKNTFKIKLVASAIAQSVQRPKNGSSRRCNYTDKVWLAVAVLEVWKKS